MKDIVIIAHFCRDFSETDNGRFMYLCKELSKDNCVEIITSDFSHSAKKHKNPLVHNWPFKITFIHEPGYKKNVSIKRFFSHYIWGKNVGKYIKGRKKPDVIYCAVPSLTAPHVVAKLSNRKNIKFIIDIQDLWPEAFELVFDVPILKTIVFSPFSIIANDIYRRADLICGVSETYVKRALKVNRKTSKGSVVFLGTQLSTFDNYAKHNAVAKPENEKWIGYCGTLGASYDLTVVIEALHLLKKRGVKPPRFIIMGDGERRKEFEAQARGLGVECEFTGRLPYDKMCGLLSSCDISVNPIMHNAAQSIINKHGDYASAGIPVINTQENEEYRTLIDNYKMGFNCSNADANDIAIRIEELLKNPDLCSEMGRNARKCAEERFDRLTTYQELIRQIQ